MMERGTERAEESRVKIMRDQRVIIPRTQGALLIERALLTGRYTKQVYKA